MGVRLSPVRTLRGALAAAGALVFLFAVAAFAVPALAAVLPAFSAGATTSGADADAANAGADADAANAGAGAATSGADADAANAGADAANAADGSESAAGSFWGLLTGGRLAAALRFTLTEALLSSLAAVAIGLPAAFLAARRTFPGRRFLLSLSGVPLCVPPVIIALAFVLFYGRQGYLNIFLMKVFSLDKPPVTFLYSLAGVVIAHGFYNFPVVLRTVSQVWERLPEEEEESAVLLGAGRWRIFRTVTLPRLSGAILSSAVLVFLYCFFSFVIVLLFGGIGGTTLEVELYQAARSSLDFTLAGSIALVETVVALGIVFLYMRMQRRLAAGTSGLVARRERVKIRGAGETVALAGYLFFLLVFFIGPLASILVRSLTETGSGLYSGHLVFGVGSWSTLFGRPAFPKALLSTLGTGAAAAVLATGAALFFALLEDVWGNPAVKSPEGDNPAGRGGMAFRILPMAPLAVSSVVLGFGWTLLVPRGNVAVLVLAQVAMSWPFAWTQIRTSLDRIPAAVHDASRVLSSGRLERSFRVLVPLSARGILSGAGFAFAISAGDASLPLVLSLGRFENLPLMLYRLVGSYRFSEACACAVVLAALSGFVFFLEDSGSENKELGQRNRHCRRSIKEFD